MTVLPTLLQLFGLVMLAVVVSAIYWPAGAVLACLELILIGYLMEAE